MLVDRIMVATTTVGTGPLTLSATGVRDATYGDGLAPAEALSQIANRLVPYFIINGANWAQGTGHISANGLTLTRDAREERWNGTNYAEGLLTLAGSSVVYLAPSKDEMAAGSIGVSVAIRMGAFLA